MLTCITCSSKEDDDAPRGTPTTKDVLKSLTSQIKDIALKASGSSSKGNHTRPTLESILAHRSEREPVVVVENEDEPKEWMAQVEPGVQITFVSLPNGGNDLKRIRFSRDMFDKWQAQRWWGENYERVMELYNVRIFNPQSTQNTPARSEDGQESIYSRLRSSSKESPLLTPSITEGTPRYTVQAHHNSAGSSPYPNHAKGPSVGSTTQASSDNDDDSYSLSNENDDIQSQWIETYEPGVVICIRHLPSGTKELRRVRFSREKFEEVHAKMWWETNGDRIRARYLT